MDISCWGWLFSWGSTQRGSTYVEGERNQYSSKDIHILLNLWKKCTNYVKYCDLRSYYRDKSYQYSSSAQFLEAAQRESANVL